MKAARGEVDRGHLFAGDPSTDGVLAPIQPAGDLEPVEVEFKNAEEISDSPCTGAKILGHSPQTFMRYVRANDDTARGAIEKMVEGLPPAGQPLTAPATALSLRVVGGSKSSTR